MPYPRRTPYPQQAERLATFLDKQGATLARSTVQEAVAALHGAENWRQLVAAPKPNWLQRLLGRKTWINHVVQLEDFPLTDNPQHVPLGVSTDLFETVDTEYAWLRRHVLVCGPIGLGASSFMTVLLTQHILAGGGALFFDSFDDPEAAAHLRNALHHSGRFADGTFLSCDDRTGVALDWPDILRTNGVVYAPSNALRGKPAGDDAYLMVQLTQALAERPVQPGTQQLPFLVVVGRDSPALRDSCAALYAQARAKNVCLVIETSGLSAWRQVEPELAEAVLANTATKVFLRPSTDQELSAAETLIASQAVPPSPQADWEPGSLRNRLRQLTMGDALLLRLNRLDHVKLYMMPNRARVEPEPENRPGGAKDDGA